MSSINNQAGVGGSTATITTSAVTVGGTDRLMLAAAVGLPNAATQVSDGTNNLTRNSSNIDLFFGQLKGNTWARAPGPSGSVAAQALFGSGTDTALSVVYLEGVDQTTPFAAIQTAGPTDASGATSTVASITVTGLAFGQRVMVGLVIGIAAAPLSSVVAGANTSLVQLANSAFGGDERQAVAAWLTGVAAGSSLTLSATINLGGSELLTWALVAYPINDAAAGGAFDAAGLESASASENSGAAATLSAAQAETASAGESSARTAAASAGRAEPGSAAEAVAAALTSASARVEAATAGDASAAALVGNSAVNEAASAGEVSSASAAGDYAAAVAEVAVAGHAQASSLAATATAVEAGSASDASNALAAGAFTAGLTEAAVAADLSGCTLAAIAVVGEPATATDLTGALVPTFRSVLETLTPIDLSNAVFSAVTYARAPSGAGFSRQQRQTVRPSSGSTTRPSR